MAKLGNLVIFQRAMLPAKNRLNLNRSKGSLLRSKRVTGDEFTLLGQKEQNIFKLAIVVSKKVARRAVDRNRIKRLVAQSLKDQKTFEGKLVVIAEKNLAHLKMGEVKEKLEKLLKKL